MIRGRLSLLKDYWNKFQATHIQIEVAATEEETRTNSYFSEDIFGNTEAAFLSALDALTAALPPIGSAVLNDLRSLRDRSRAALTALKNLSRPVEYWDDVLIFHFVRKLDKESHREWEMRMGEDELYPSLADWDAFINVRIRTLESLASSRGEENSVLRVIIPLTAPLVVYRYHSCFNIPFGGTALPGLYKLLMSGQKVSLRSRRKLR